MVNTDFNLDMDNYIRKIKKKRTDPIDYDHGEAKGKTVLSSESIDQFSDKEIIIESQEDNKFKRFILSIFSRPKNTDEDEFECVVEEEIDGKPVENMTEQDVEELEDDIEELEVETEGFFHKLLKLFSSRRNDEYIDDEEFYESDTDNEPEMLSDTKNAFKAINNWLNKLSPEEKEKFKDSMDFKIYKAFLEKYNLIKKD